MGEPGGKCPNFRDQNQQMIWLLGSAVGLMSVMVMPRPVALSVFRWTSPQSRTCCRLSRRTPKATNAGGVLPMAIRGAIWTVVPGITPARQKGSMETIGPNHETG